MTWLIHKLTPDFKTISDFRKDNIDTVKSLFRKFNLFLKEIGPFKSLDITVDGTKTKTVNARERSYTRAYLKMEQDRIDKRIDKYLHDMDENDAIEENIDKEKIRKAIEKLREKKETLKEAELKMDSSGMDEISLTDPDARQMKTRQGVDVCYNGHIAVESENHLITDYTLDNNTNDYASVLPLAEGTREFMDSFDLSADKCHFSLPNLEDLSEAHIPAYIPVLNMETPTGRLDCPNRNTTGASSYMIRRRMCIYALRATRCTIISFAKCRSSTGSGIEYIRLMPANCAPSGISALTHLDGE